MLKGDEREIYSDPPGYDGENPNEGYFSRSDCDCCNAMAGQRYDIVGLNCGDDPEDFIELTVCEDCYGDLCC